MTNGLRSIRFLLLSSAMVVPAVAYGQTGAQQGSGSAPTVQSNAARPTVQSDGNESADIVVTARKRSESIQNVPLSITAIGPRDLKDRDIRNLSDIASVAPSLTFQPGVNGFNTIVMRGLATGAAGSEISSSETVAIYFDDVPISSGGRNPDLRPVDLARVEVLRGPQGTLYGAGSLGGAIKYVGAGPRYDALSVGGNVDLSTTHHGGFGNNLTAVVNLPIVTDSVALRVVGYNSFSPGYIRNIDTGENHVGDTRVRGFRAQLGVKPTDNLELVGKVFYQDSKYGPGTPVIERDVASAPNGQPEGLEQAIPTITHGSDHFRLYNLTATWNIGFADITSLTSRVIRRQNAAYDASYIVQEFFDPRLTTQANEDSPSKQWLQEVRISSSSAGPLHWLAGAYYSDTQRKLFQFSPTANFLAYTGIDNADFGASDPNLAYQATAQLKENQKALFGEAAYDLGRFTLTAGGRLFKQVQHYEQRGAGAFNGGVTEGASTARGSGFNPRVILSYKPSRTVMISAQAAKGFRLGGGNDPVTVAACSADLNRLGIPDGPGSFKQDSVWSYELNAKMQFADGRITFNPAIFRTDYSHIQVRQLLPSCDGYFTTNAGTARSQGVELDTSFRITDNFSIHGGMSYTDAKLTSDVPEGVNGVNGERLPLSPRWTANALFRYEHDIGDWHGFAQADVRYQSNVIESLQSNVDPIPARTVVGTRIGATRNKLEASIYADNLFDSRKAITAEFVPGRSYQYQILRPRQIGISLSYNY